MSYTNSIYHIIFRTYRSHPTLALTECEELYRYIWGYCKNHNIKLYRIGGVEDHVHALVGLPASLSIAQFMNNLKTATSKWLSDNASFPHFEGWSKGYAALSYGKEMVPTLKNYIQNQVEHHKKVAFSNELRAILQKEGIEIDEQYFLVD